MRLLDCRLACSAVCSVWKRVMASVKSVSSSDESSDLVAMFWSSSRFCRDCSWIFYAPQIRSQRRARERAMRDREDEAA